MARFSPLDGLFVLDASVTLPGPYGTTLLAALGADVLSIEPPGGDPLRERGPRLADGTPSIYAALNRGKPRIEVDLKDERGRELVHDLAREADVFVEGFRPGVVDRLGVGPDTLQALNPRLVYCSISGFGQSGPRRDQPGHALNYEGLAGMLGADPSLPNLPVSDLTGGLMLAFAVTAAVHARESDGRGRYIDLSLFETVASWNLWQAPWLDAGADTGDPLVRGEFPCYNVYGTADGRHLTLGILERPFWETLCRELDRPDLLDRQFERGGRGSDAYRELQAVFRERSLEEWVERLGDEVPLAAVQTAAEALDDPQVTARELVEEDEAAGGRRRTGFPVRFDGERPSGEPADARALLAAAGYDDERLAALREAGVFAGQS